MWPGKSARPRGMAVAGMRQPSPAELTKVSESGLCIIKRRLFTVAVGNDDYLHVAGLVLPPISSYTWTMLTPPPAPTPRAVPCAAHP